MKVVIVGGGLAGLLTAAELDRNGIEDVVVLERSEHPGGVARTITRDGYSLEPAAGTLTLPHPALTPILDHLGVETTPAAGPGTRYLHTGDRLVALPASPAALAAPILPAGAKARALAEVCVRSGPMPEETLAAFARRRFGARAGDLIAWLMASGVFAGDPERLSVAACFPMLVGLEQDCGSLIGGMIERRRRRPPGSQPPSASIPVGGMAQIGTAAARRLGGRLRTGAEVTTVERSGAGWRVALGEESFDAAHVVFACDAETATRLLGIETSPVQRAPVVVLGLGGPAIRMPIPDGFGVLTTPGLGLATLGVLLESSYAPERAPEGHALVKVIAGGATRPDVASWSDDRLVDQLGTEVARLLAVDIEASFVELVRREIPQYPLGHTAWVRELEERLEPGIHVTGWDYRGVGVSHLAADARRIYTSVQEAR